MAKKLKITLQKSTAHTKEMHRRTVKALGLKRMNHFVVHEDTPQIRGMIHAVQFLVDVEEVSS